MLAKYAQELKEFVDELAFRQRVAELQEMYKTADKSWNLDPKDKHQSEQH